MKPLFIFSLPRSGSTLLQRILMSNPNIVSIAEPWLMLPFVYSFKREGTLTEYSHMTCFTAFKDMIQNLPRRENDYYEFLREFAYRIYSSYCKNNEVYFLDKTPRYYLIIPEIAKIFPEAKFIFLFRNPVQIYSSILNTWGENSFTKLYDNYIDIETGPKLLTEGYNLLKEKSFSLRYEDFILAPERHLKDLMLYLELPYYNDMLESFSNQDLSGRMGNSIHQHNNVTTISLEKWKNTFNTPFRKWLLKNYINSLGDQTISLQGYSKENILREIKSLGVKHHAFLYDVFDYIKSYLIRKYNLNLLFSKSQRWSRNKYIS
jgi:hypothetical protein